MSLYIVVIFEINIVLSLSLSLFNFYVLFILLLFDNFIKQESEKTKDEIMAFVKQHRKDLTLFM